MLPSPDILNEFEHGKFVLSNLAAKRAKQLREGAPPLVRIESNHPLTIALAEIAAGKIKAILPDIVPPIDRHEVVVIDETVPSELGLLLPALDESEVSLIVAEDHDADHEHEDDEAISLSDLVGDEDEEEVAVAAADDDTLSLSDIAEQETSLEEEETEE
jgi:DNA-directed RNA polymerase subunit omega